MLPRTAAAEPYNFLGTELITAFVLGEANSARPQPSTISPDTMRINPVSGPAPAKIRRPAAVAPIPAEAQDRRTEITGPVSRKMVINALNSGAQVFMADFEDANAPTWATVYVVEPGDETLDVNTTTVRPVTVKLGVTDGSTTELLEGLNEGDVVATGTMTITAESNARNPFNPFSNRRR